jgi:ABC-type amino acid transport substrate-binding protein
VVTGVVNGRFATLLAAMNLVIFTLLATASLTGVMKISKKKLVNYVALTLVLTVGLIAVTRAYFSIAVKNEYERDHVIANMQSKVMLMPREVYKSAEEAQRKIDPSKPVLQRIRETDVLRVGFNPDNMPFTYFSETGELIGFDVDMAQLLARELGVKLEFVPFEYKKMADQLDSGVFDVIMSGVVMTTTRLEKIVYSAPYMDATLCFVVKDHRRAEFATEKAVKEIEKLKIGIPHVSSYFLPKVINFLPRADIIEVDSVEEYFTTNKHGLDALLFDAEGGSAWTLRYPKYKVVVPKPHISKIPMAYPVSNDDREFADFLSQWITLKKNSLESRRLYDHWILGVDAEPRHPRWSVIRNLLGWVK